MAMKLDLSYWGKTVTEDISEGGCGVRVPEREREEVKEVWRKMHNGELHDLYLSQGLAWSIKPKGLRRTVACNAYGRR
jgi:hypothetical protein